MKIFGEIAHLAEFDKDFEKLSKRFRTLEEDLKVFISTQLNLYHKQGIDNKGVLPVSGLGIAAPKIYPTIFEISWMCHPEPCPDENQDCFRISPNWTNG